MDPREEREVWVSDGALFGGVFAALMLAGLAPHPWGVGVLAFAAAAATFSPTRLRRRAVHELANHTAFETPIPLTAPWVIDGDTIDDRATGVRYRLANIDAPETGDNAKCFRERARGEMARWEAIRLVRSAAVVSVRRTWRTDIYGRRIAFVLVDGRDLGRLLVIRGLARPWKGQREPWCGPRGGLAAIAATGAKDHACAACRHWR